MPKSELTKSILLRLTIRYQLGKIDKLALTSMLRIPLDGYPAVFVGIGAQPGALARETSVATMKKIALMKVGKLMIQTTPQPGPVLGA